LDIRGDAGTPVHASVGGKVINVGNYNGGSRYYWEIAILDAHGFLWQYHHVNHESIPQEVKDAFAAGGEIEAGSLIGEIVDWPVDTLGETFNHVHLNVLGAGEAALNPFAFLEKLDDTKGPEIRSIGLLSEAAAPLSGNTVSGSYGLYVEARDLILHDKFYLPPYHVEMRIDGGAPETVWTFDAIPGGADINAEVPKFYVESRTCGNYRCRRATINLGYQPEGTRSFPTEKGSHQIEVLVQDYAGNSDSQSFQWTVE
jgi:hypothetical protein